MGPNQCPGGFDRGSRGVADGVRVRRGRRPGASRTAFTSVVHAVDIPFNAVLRPFERRPLVSWTASEAVERQRTGVGGAHGPRSVTGRTPFTPRLNRVPLSCGPRSRGSRPALVVPSDGVAPRLWHCCKLCPDTTPWRILDGHTMHVQCSTVHWYFLSKSAVTATSDSAGHSYARPITRVAFPCCSPMEVAGLSVSSLFRHSPCLVPACCVIPVACARPTSLPAHHNPVTGRVLRWEVVGFCYSSTSGAVLVPSLSAVVAPPGAVWPCSLPHPPAPMPPAPCTGHRSACR